MSDRNGFNAGLPTVPTSAEGAPKLNPGSIADELGDIVTAGDSNLGDTATATYDRELDESLEEGAKQTLIAIEDALRKIDDGSYGTCEVCGKPIAPERLAAIPWARLCIDDQRKADN